MSSTEKNKQRLENKSKRLEKLQKWKQGIIMKYVFCIVDIEQQFPMVHHSRSWKENIKDLKNKIEEVVIENETQSLESNNTNSNIPQITIKEMKVYLAIMIVRIFC